MKLAASLLICESVLLKRKEQTILASVINGQTKGVLVTSTPFVCPLITLANRVVADGNSMVMKFLVFHPTKILIFHCFCLH